VGIRLFLLLVSSYPAPQWIAPSFRLVTFPVFVWVRKQLRCSEAVRDSTSSNRMVLFLALSAEKMFGYNMDVGLGGNLHCTPARGFSK